MPNRKPDPSVRLARLKAMRAGIEPGTTMTAGEMCKALGWTWRHMKRDMIDQDASFPVLRRGAEGHAWLFDVPAVLDYLIARDEAAIAERAQRAEQMARLSGIGLKAVSESDRPGGLSIDELRVATQALVTVTRMKREQGELVPAEPVRLFFQDYHQHIQQEILGLLSRIDGPGQLPAGIRQAIEDDMRNLLVDLQKRMDNFVRERLAYRPGAA